MLNESVRQIRSSQAHLEPSCAQTENKSTPRSVPAWFDLLVTLLWIVATIGILAYFIGVVAAIAVALAIIVALALCANSAIEHTIELDHFKRR